MSSGTAPAARLQAALAKLQTSRAALRHELLPAEAGRQREAGEPSGRGSAGLPQWWRKLRRLARRAPVLNLAAEAARSWWRQQPWHASAELLTQGVLAQSRPLVRRHPLAAVALAAACGAAVVACRPWRWQALGQPLRDLPGRTVHGLLALLAQAPLQAALVGLLLSGLRAERQSANDGQDVSAKPQESAPGVGAAEAHAGRQPG